MLRTEDNQFYKDTLKKLIFALEQHQGSNQNKEQNAAAFPAPQGNRLSPTSTQTFSHEFTSKRPAKSQRHAATAVGTSRPPINLQSGNHKQ